MRRRIKFRHGGARLSLLAALALFSAWTQASAIPDPAFATTNGRVYSAVIANNILYIGGEFTEVGGLARENFAAINLATGLVSTLILSVNGPVYALAVSSGGTTLFMGGEFTGVGAASRNRLAAMSLNLSLNTAAVTPWNPGADGAVRALARSPDGGTIYIGGDFTAIAVGGNSSPRNYIASVSATTGAVLPWNPNADARVRALVLAGNAGRLYAAGDFSFIGGQVRHRLAALGIASGGAIPWNPEVAGDRVNAVALAGNVLYVGGSFTALGGAQRNNLAALATNQDSNMAGSWNPDVTGGEVRVLALVADGSRLYAGGTFTTANGGTARQRIAGFRTIAGPGNAIAWDPGLDSSIGSIDVLAASASGAMLYTGGAFTRIGGSDRSGLAAFAIGTPETVADPPGGAYQLPQTVSLVCNDKAGSGCARICRAAGAAEPVVPDDCVTAGSVDILFADDVTVKFFSEDNDGNRETLRTERYAIDNDPPVTDVSLPGRVYGVADIKPVRLTCNDNTLEFGCTTYYTLDGAAPTRSSPIYSGPISLEALFPPENIPRDEVDPLLHLAGRVTLRLFSVDDAGNEEAPQTVVYDVDLAPPVVTVSHPTGSYPAPQIIILTCNDGEGTGCAGMFYTTDGTPPTLDSSGIPVAPTARYQGPLTFSSATTLAVLALDNANNGSSGVVGIYAFSTPAADTRAGVGAMDAKLLLLLLIAAALDRKISQYRRSAWRSVTRH